MKVALLALLFLFAGSILFAQEQQKFAVMLQVNSIIERNPHGYNPFGGYWDEDKDLYEGPNIQTRDHSFSSGLALYNYRKENLLWRVRAGVIRTSIRSGWSYTDASFTYTYDAGKTEMDYYLAPGVTKMFTVNRFEYFAGVEMPVTVYGPAKVFKQYGYGTAGAPEQRYHNETTGSYRNGFSAGLGAFGGFSVKFYRSFTFGPEVGFAFLYSDLGSSGAFTSTTTDGASYTENLHFTKNYRKLGVTGLEGSLNLSWWF